MVGERARELHGRDRACLASHIVASLNQAGGPDVEELRRISAEHGLLSRALRRRVWPILLNIPTDRWGNLVREDGSRLDDGDGRLVLSPREHPEKKQVELDVVRSLSHFGMRARDRSARLPQLTILITSVLKSDPSLHYYQGFNDVCSIALLVMGSEAAARPVAESLAKHHFRAAMFENMEAVQQAIRLIVGIVAKRDPPLARSLTGSGVDPLFAISWILTWFAHNLHSLPAVERVYDFLLAAHPAMSLYLSAALLQHRRSAILAAHGDYPTIHALLQERPASTVLNLQRLPPTCRATTHYALTARLPGTLQELPSDLPLERLIAEASRSFHTVPPAALIAASSLDAVCSPRGSPRRGWLTLPSLAEVAAPAQRRAAVAEPPEGFLITWSPAAVPSLWVRGRILALAWGVLGVLARPLMRLPLGVGDAVAWIGRMAARLISPRPRRAKQRARNGRHLLAAPRDGEPGASAAATAEDT